jgi:hypothetical protein
MWTSEYNTNCTQRLSGGEKCRKKTLSDLALPLHVVDEFLKKCIAKYGNMCVYQRNI